MDYNRIFNRAALSLGLHLLISQGLFAGEYRNGFPKLSMKVKHSDFSEKISKGNIWRVQGRSNGVVICLHGLQTHATWFTPLAKELNKARWTVIAVDRRGSGKNSGPPFHRGHVENRGRLFNDLKEHVRLARIEAGNRPLILLGTSWGANLAGVYATRKIEPKIDGLILLVPATEVKLQPTILKKAGIALSSVFFPKMKWSLPFSAQHYLVDVSGVTDFPANTYEKNCFLAGVLENDTAMLKRPTARTLMVGNRLAKEWKKQARLIDTKELPILLITADYDQIMDNESAKRILNMSDDRREITSKSIPAGHGVQITHPKEIASEIMLWGNHKFD